MKQPRFTFRALMVFVCFAAFTVCGYRQWRRSKEFAARAQEYKARRYIHRHNLSSIRTQRKRWGGRFPDVHETERLMHENCELYEDLMYRKYHRAMLFPWLTVEPDPVAPTDPWCKGRVQLHPMNYVPYP
jgi:hypothetical protein